MMPFTQKFAVHRAVVRTFDLNTLHGTLLVTDRAYEYVARPFHGTVCRSWPKSGDHVEVVLASYDPTDLRFRGEAAEEPRDGWTVMSVR